MVEIQYSQINFLSEWRIQTCIKGSFDSKRVEYMEMIGRNSFLLTRHVESLLHVFKFKGEKTINVEPENIHEICSEVVELFQPIATARGIAFDEIVLRNHFNMLSTLVFLA